jgi:hypothetical protein
MCLSGKITGSSKSKFTDLELNVLNKAQVVAYAMQGSSLEVDLFPFLLKTILIKWVI